MDRSHRPRRLLAGCLAGALLLAACGEADDAEDRATSATASAEDAGAGRSGEESGDGDGGAAAPAPALDTAAGAATASDAAPERVEGLRAGSIDDNVDFTGFLDYLARVDGLGILRRPLDPTGRSIVTVTDNDDRPAAGVEVTVTWSDATATLRTTADGTARFHPAFYALQARDQAVRVVYRVTDGAERVQVDAELGQDVTIEVEPVDRAATVPLDVLFLLDATGSMGDEIDRLTATVDTVARQVATLDPAPDVRFAVTTYRDEGDDYVARTVDFTGDVDAFAATLADVRADGGGDYPEALDEGLADALSTPTWREPGSTVQLVFLIADAPAQVGRDVAMPYTDSVRAAIARGIKILPIASSESDDQAEVIFRQLAQATGARFVFLANGAGGAALGETTDIATTDYEELPLDALVVRLISEELAALSGGDVTPPPTSTTSTTRPAGQ